MIVMILYYTRISSTLPVLPYLRYTQYNIPSMIYPARYTQHNIPSTIYPVQYPQHDIPSTIQYIQYDNNQDMSDAMMPISVDALSYRTMLCELGKLVTMSSEMFDKAWPYVDSVYTKLQSELLQAYGTVHVQKYECRLRKSKTSSTAQLQYTTGTGNKVLKRRHSSIRDQHPYHVRIKVSRPVDGTAVTIQRLDEHTHTHDIKESFQIKKPSILANSIKAEVVKNDSAS